MTELDKTRLKLEKEKVKLARDKIQDDVEEMENDGFLEALNGTAKDDWHEEG